MAENRKRQQPSSPASRKAQRLETESIWAALHARHCIYCHEWVSDTLFARCAEAIRARGDGATIIDTLPASMRDRVRAARWSTRCRGPPHSAYFPERVDKFSYSHSRWKIECSRCDKRWIADNRIVGDMPPDNWRCMEGDPRPSIAGDDGCAVPGHAFGVEGLRERYARFPWDLTIFWDEGMSPTSLAEKLAAAGRTAEDVVNRTAEGICAEYFKAEPWIECRECFALDWRHGVGAGLLAAQKEPSTDNATTSATTLGVFRAVVEASVNDAVAAAAAEAPPRFGETVATLRYGARAVQQLGNGNVRYNF